MNFEEWFKELRQLMIDEFNFPPDKPDAFYGDAESWKEYYDDGYTPYDAIREDLSCAV